MSVNIGFGSALKYSTDGGSTWTTVAKVSAFTPNKVSVAKVAIDAMDNATFNGLPVEDAIAGWVSPGTYGSTMYYQSAGYSAIHALVGITYKFKVIKSDGSGYVFGGYIAELGEQIPLKEAMMMDFTIQINGAAVPVFSTSQS